MGIDGKAKHPKMSNLAWAGVVILIFACSIIGDLRAAANKARPPCASQTEAADCFENADRARRWWAR